MAKNGQKTEVTVRQESALVNLSHDVPAYIRQDGKARGSEDVGTSDLVIPRIEVVQSLSPARDKHSPDYIEGADEGMLYNNVTRQLYGESVLFIPVVFKKQWLVWRDRDEGGGFRGAFDTREEAEGVVAEQEDSGWEAIETHQQFGLCLTSGRPEAVVVSMSRSKIKVSKRFNAFIMNVGGDRFARVYKLFAQQDQNDKGDKYYNLSFEMAGFPRQEHYAEAEALYNKVQGGTKIVADQTFEAEREVSSEGTEY